MRSHCKLILCASSGAFALLAASGTSALAQTTKTSSASGDGAAMLGEIVVTAQKRAENVQEVPISVTVIGSEQLARRGVQSVQDLSQASASLEFTTPAAAPGGGGFVRGIGTNQVGNATAASSVSVVLDGVVLGNTPISDIFDTERVEVLKGPQGTLFGSSVSAGLLSITTKAPKIGERSGYVTTELAAPGFGSGYTRSVVRAAVNLPVTERSALRIAANYYDNYGESKNTFLDKKEDVTSYGIRARYLADLTDNLTFNLIADYNRIYAKYPGGLLWRSAPAGSQLSQALAACGFTASPDNTDNCQGSAYYDRTWTGGVSGQFDWKLGDVTLTSITSYRERNERSVGNLIGLAPSIARQYLQTCQFFDCAPAVKLEVGLFSDPQIAKNTLLSQEVRLTSEANHQLEWVAGLYYQRSTFSSHKPSILVVHPTAAFHLDADLTLAEGVAGGDADGEDYAAFGNATWYLQPETRIIGGLRFTHSRVSERAFDPVNAHVPDTFSLATTDNAFTWRVAVQHDFTPDTMVYVTAATGYKAPQINDQLTAASVSNKAHALTPVKAEKPMSFEVGIKQTMLGGKLYVDADLFYTRVKDFQTQQCVPSINGIQCSNINVNKVISKGFEWDIFGRPFQGTVVNISGIVNSAKYPNGFRGADLTDLSDEQLNYAPKFKMTASLEQTFDLSDDYSLVVGGDVTYRTKQSMYLSADPVFVVPSQALFNARVTLRAGDKWSVGIFGRNLGNKVYPVQIYPSPFVTGGLWHVLDPNSQRVVGVQADAKF